MEVLKQMSVAQTCALYNQGVQDISLTHSMQFANHCADKARVHNKSLMIAFIGLPCNLGWWAISKVATYTLVL